MTSSTGSSSFLSDRLACLADRCAMAVMAIGLLGICGWIFGIDLLTRVMPHFHSMKFNTALSFFLAGSALYCRRNSPIRVVIGISLMLIGILTTCEYMLVTDFGIDQFFINDKAKETIFPGRMSPATAGCFILSGLGLSIVGSLNQFWRAAEEIVALMVGVIGSLTILGYLLSSKIYYLLPGFASVALPTGVAFFLLGLGMLCVIANSLPALLLKTWRNHRTIWLGFGLLLFLLAITGILAVAATNTVIVTSAHGEFTRIFLFGALITGMVLTLIIIKQIVLTVLRNETTLLINQEKLQQSRMDLDRAQEVGQIGWWRMNTVKNILTWSDENHRIFGVPKGTPLSYDTFLNLVHPEDRQFVNGRWMAALRGDPYDLEHRIIVGDKVKWVREKAYLEFDKSGSLLGGFGITQDVTKRKQAEIDFFNVRESLNIAVEAAQMGTWDLDLTSDFSGHRNLRHDQIFGYETPQANWGYEIARRHVLEEDREIFDAAFERARETGVLNFEVRIIWPDGSIHWMSVRGRFYFDGQGMPVRGAGINYDITERKQVEDALRDADRRKNEFLAMLGHELRNPLTPLSNVAEILNMPSCDEPTRRHASDVLHRNIQHITQLVDDLLDLSRITQGLIKIQKRRVELGGLVKDSADTVQATINVKQQTLRLNLPAKPVWVDGDPIRLVQVFSNLLNNAVKYTGEGGHVDISVRQENQNISIRIKDDGIGIEAGLLPKIFDLFTQGENALRRCEGGLGIGLTLVKKLVELHGGEIKAYSKGLNQGSEFTVCLPSCFEYASENLMNPPQVLDSPATGLRVLLIDDNPDVAQSLATWLDLAGYQVKIAATGAQGISFTEDFKPDIVILDVGLPDLDGYQVSHILRELPGGNNLYIIAMSGYAPNPDESRKNQHSFDHYLIKPPRISQLRQLLADFARPGQSLENLPGN